MGTPFLGEIRAVTFNFAPKGWAFCNGQLLAINQNQALFSLLGTTYGGNGTTTFALPDLQARVPLHASTTHTLGQAGGEAQHTLTAAEMPAHTHAAIARHANGDNPSPAGRAWGLQPVDQTYAIATSPLVAMSPAAVGSAGGAQPHPNLPPYLVVNFVIALTGIFPARS
ncbi:MAG TPA: tail fiber protein [Polyangiaceae bacterium]|jgi:microcystin-dependent protein|nr:tail fiber protein [Polyangiaceae bacterium]